MTLYTSGDWQIDYGANVAHDVFDFMCEKFNVLCKPEVIEVNQCDLTNDAGRCTITFAVKGSSLYLAKTLLIQVGGEVQKVLQLQIMQSILKSNVKHYFHDVIITDEFAEYKTSFSKIPK